VEREGKECEKQWLKGGFGSEGKNREGNVRQEITAAIPTLGARGREPAEDVNEKGCGRAQGRTIIRRLDRKCPRKKLLEKENPLKTKIRFKGRDWVATKGMRCEE